MNEWLRRTLAPAAASTRVEHFDYRALRLVVGLIGFLLPLLLVVRAHVFGDSPLMRSISSYYHTPGQDLFVGSLCVIAMFLLAYRGKATLDGRVSTLGGLAALVIAFFPTDPEPPLTDLQELIGTVHLIGAGVFFVVLAGFCLWLFPNAPRFMDYEQRNVYEVRRDRIYRGCGWGIVISLLAIGVTKVLPVAQDLAWQPVFWFEWLALALFGVSWITAGKYWRISFLVAPNEAYKFKDL